MLHPILKEKISKADIRKIYELKVNLTTSEIKNLVHREIKSMRGAYKDTSIDALAVKLSTFGDKTTGAAPGAWYEKKLEELLKDFFNRKAVPNLPEDIGKCRSIEFECVFRSRNHEKEFLKGARKGGLGKCIHVKDDGSLRANSGDRDAVTREVVLTFKKGEEEKVRITCDLLTANAYVNESCGTHVHFDMRNVDPSKVELYGKRVARCVGALRKMLPQSRRNNEYCRRVINTLDDGRSERYAFVNLHAYHAHKTLEIRGHSGTIDGEKILNWIALLEMIMTTQIRRRRTQAERAANVEVQDESTGNIDTIEEVVRRFKVPENLATYMNQRAQYFEANASATN